MVAPSRSSILSKLNQRWSATTLGNSLSLTSLSSTVALVFVYLFLLRSSQLTILKQIGATHCKLFVEFMTCAIHHFCHFAPAQHLGCTCFRVRFSSWWLTFCQHSPQVIAHHCIFLILSRTAPKNHALCVVLLPFADREIGVRSNPTYILRHRFSSDVGGPPDCSYYRCLDWLRNILR
jgi:hypothetical protein